MVALLEAVVDRRGDDLGLVAVDAAGGELLRDGERVEHRGRLPRRHDGQLQRVSALSARRAWLKVSSEGHRHGDVAIITTPGGKPPKTLARCGLTEDLVYGLAVEPSSGASWSRLVIRRAWWSRQRWTLTPRSFSTSMSRSASRIKRLRASSQSGPASSGSDPRGGVRAYLAAILAHGCGAVHEAVRLHWIELLGRVLAT